MDGDFQPHLRRAWPGIVECEKPPDLGRYTKMKAEYLEPRAGGEECWKCQCFCEAGNVKEVLRKGDRIKRTPRVNIEERDIKLL